jgi:hypothetical protein
MFRFAFAFLLALLLVVPSGLHASETPEYTPIPSRKVADLLNGDVIKDVQRGTPNRGYVIALIQAPPEELYEIVCDYPRIPHWSRPLRRASIISESGNERVIEGETELPWPISNRNWRIRSVSSTTTIQGQTAHINSWTYIPGSGNIADTFGYWLIMRWPDDTRYSYVKYVINADPDIAIPDSVLNLVTRRTLPQLISNLRTRHSELYGNGR